MCEKGFLKRKDMRGVNSWSGSGIFASLWGSWEAQGTSCKESRVGWQKEHST